MADFYKGYFEDRYSFAHSDKKWYEKHKQDVSDYNHRYYEAHKKHVADQLRKGELFKPGADDPKVFEDAQPGDILTRINGYGKIEYLVKTDGTGPSYIVDTPEKALKLSKEMVDKRLSNVHNAASKMEETFNSKGRKPGAIRLQNGRKVSSFENARKANERNYR